MSIPITLIPGDGIGPSIIEATVRLLEAAGADIAWDRQLAGTRPPSTRSTTRFPTRRSTRFGGRRSRSRGRSRPPVGKGFRSINVALRMAFDLFANVRPAKSVLPGLRFDGVDIVLVRENTEGLYIGVENYIKIGNDEHAAAQSVAVVTRFGAERIHRYAFEYAIAHGRKKVTIVHKANILKYSQGLFLEEGRRIAKEYEGRMVVEERIVDACAMELVMRPSGTT